MRAALALLFWVLAAWVVASAVLVVTAKSPIASVLFLVSTLLATAGLFLTLHAEFVALMQVLVYAGAILVLFLFVVMLLDLREGDEAGSRGLVGTATAAALCGLLFLLLAKALYAHDPGAADLSQERSFGTPRDVAAVLFSAQTAREGETWRFMSLLVPFEAVSVLLLAALVGTVALARREPPPEGPPGAGPAPRPPLGEDTPA